MILLHIITETIEQAEEISELLIEQKLILNSFVVQQSALDKIKNNPQFLMMCRTKALLFSKIEELLTGKYPQKMPVLYSVPIVHMDWEQSKELIDIKMMSS